jgi:hypothetical protein
LQGQGFAEPSGVKGGSVFHLGTRTNIWGIINANGHGAAAGRRVSAALAAMREWLDRNRYEPTKFNYDQDEEAVVLSVEFPNDQEGAAFAGRFDREKPTRPTPPDV